MKSNQQIEPKIAEDFSSVAFAIADGLPDIVLHMDKLHEAIIRRAACVGMAQVRIVDAAAIPMQDKDGNIIPKDKRLALKRDKMQELVDWYETGTDQWSRIGAAKTFDGGLLFEALCRLYKDVRKPEEVRAFLDGLDDKQQAALREDDTVEPLIRAIKTERNAGKPKADTKSLLAGLTQTPTPTTDETPQA